MGLFGFTFVKFETMIWPSIRFDYKLIELWKAFRHFLTANRKKTFQRIFSYDSGCKRKLWAIFLSRVHLWKKQTPGRHFNTCLREWKLFSLYIFHRSIYLSLLIVSSLFAILIAVPFVFSRSWTSLAGVVKMPRVSNAFEDYASL